MQDQQIIFFKFNSVKICYVYSMEVVVCDKRFNRKMIYSFT